MLITFPMALAALRSQDHKDRTGHLTVVLPGADPPTCKRGYEGTKQRLPQDIADVPAKRNARCAEPRGGETNVRGSGSVPRPSSGGQQRAGSAALTASTSAEAEMDTFVSVYDPLTGG
jgi:phospholipid/cholesterol/gamma-HCH transport system substrate-binding protein